MSTTLGPLTGSESHGESPAPRGTTSVWAALKTPLRDLIRPLASLQLTVALFALSMVLVFFGTLAQIDKSVWTVVDQYFRSLYVWIPFQLIAEFGKKFFDLDEKTVWKGTFPFPGGWLLGGLMLANLFAAHLVRFKLTWRRSGVIILHLGVILLMTGELVTGLYAVESRMMLQVGESRNFIDNARNIELAFTDDATHQATIIPQDRLSEGTTIDNSNLPVDVEVLGRFKNTAPKVTVGGDDSDTIVSIYGGRYRVEPAPEGSGVSSDQQEDVPGVRVRLLKKGTKEVLLERIYSLWDYENGPASRRFMALPSHVTIDGHTYTVELRSERVYKPYTITLLDFEHKKYAGTDTAKDFASTIRLQDPETGDDREVRIWMNHPLRHRGETFYQLSTLGNITASGDQKDTGTVLQVVKNPGWILPYVSCIVVTLGMLIHFGMGIVRFTAKRAAKLGVAVPNREASAQTTFIDPTSQKLYFLKKYFPWAIVGICALYSVMLLFPKQEEYKEFDLSKFGEIPCLDEGRVKPLDSIARTKMLFISGRSEFEDQAGKTHPAILWLLEIMVSDDPYRGPASEEPVFRIDNEQLLQLLELPGKPGSYRYSIKEIRPKFGKFLGALKTARELNENKRDLFHSKVLELASRLETYEQLARHLVPKLIPKEQGSDTWLTLAEIDEQAVQPFAQQAEAEARDEVINDPKWRELLQNPDLKMTPEQQNEIIMEMREKIGQLTEKKIRQIAARERKTISPAAAAFGNILAAYRDNKPKTFAEAINTYTSEYVYPLNSEFHDTVRFEEKLNQANPLIVASFLFVFAAIFRILGWLVWERPLSLTAWGLASISFVLLIATFLGRMYIMQRPLVFVTNLYSSSLMIGAGALTAGLIMERIYKNGLGLIIGTLAAASAGVIAHHLSTDGKDTLGALVAVLDTNYWLASHVTTVTLGYSATYLAGFLGLAFIVWGLCLPTLTKEKHQVLGSMIYGTLCFATLLSFVGTVLGGIWADQSWGRFWGWDPKENGAVLIVLWNSLTLHARWCGLVKQRGMAVLAIVGIMVTTWSWFGTNQLGAGLHNYGFNKSLADGCMYTWIICLIVIGIGLIPLKYWASFAKTGLPYPESPIATAGLGSGGPTGAGNSGPSATNNGQQTRQSRGKRPKNR
jgi:ABC-type transport system involved in cytochrome c biogenesis permease subunit